MRLQCQFCSHEKMDVHEVKQDMFVSSNMTKTFFRLGLAFFLLFFFKSKSTSKKGFLTFCRLFFKIINQFFLSSRVRIFRCVQRLRRISMNCFVGWSVRLSVRPLVGWSVRPSVTNERFSEYLLYYWSE